MPPALSDEESSDVGEFTTPPRASSRKKSTSAAAVDELDDMKAGPASDEEEGDEDEDLDEDEFVVEAIKKHMVYDDGSLQFQVKWEGYEAKKDLTWEPEENLRGLPRRSSTPTSKNSADARNYLKSMRQHQKRRSAAAPPPMVHPAQRLQRSDHDVSTRPTLQLRRQRRVGVLQQGPGRRRSRPLMHARMKAVAS